MRKLLKAFYLTESGGMSEEVTVMVMEQRPLVGYGNLYKLLSVQRFEYD
jgi:hypothetical protein